MAIDNKRLYEWVKKIHMYSGLLTFLALVVWGVTGIHSVFLAPPGQYQPPPVSSIREIPYKAESRLDDQQLATAIYQAIKIPLAGGRYNVHRDGQANLAFNVFTINGGRDVTFLEDKGIVRIAHRANGLFDYLSSMHTAHSRRHRQSLAARAWGIFNEIANWAFLFMTFSGVYMWIATRPRLLWAQLSFGAMAVVTVALWIAIR
jgi:hypothetical protein